MTGYPKEGLQEGDLAGAISIIIPATSYIEDQEQTLIVTICFFAILIVLIAVTLFAVIRTVITKPLAKLAIAATDMSDGKLDVSLDSTRAQGELGDLVDRFTTMARQLEEAYAGLEEKVADKTEEIRQAEQRRILWAAAQAARGEQRPAPAGQQAARDRQPVQGRLPRRHEP